MRRPESLYAEGKSTTAIHFYEPILVKEIPLRNDGSSQLNFICCHDGERASGGLLTKTRSTECIKCELKICELSIPGLVSDSEWSRYLEILRYVAIEYPELIDYVINLTEYLVLNYSNERFKIIKIHINHLFAIIAIVTKLIDWYGSEGSSECWAALSSNWFPKEELFTAWVTALRRQLQGPPACRQRIEKELIEVQENLYSDFDYRNEFHAVQVSHEDRSLFERAKRLLELHRLMNVADVSTSAKAGTLDDIKVLVAFSHPSLHQNYVSWCRYLSRTIQVRLLLQFPSPRLFSS
ncbi:hypothetical protein GNI_129570 [Gregarina niphandrodes]|uniref:Uncharacterized protein n=1 Tax=Gregarina niphandrodes TaxID=110365 RepID=A0A023B1T1_GRENI|nr:hypothetical protein GNI_129570 [Gregarina niphandrodes]EZG48219.1 hypothetical protein GNI_129570 [Gregarina niphandrodes]|eukprot:XP_011132115.1 hypothetical protein GNI_129570 [Gregarina niphandrodes]